SDIHYEVMLDLTQKESPSGDPSDVFESATTIRFSCTRPGTDTFLDLSARSLDRLEVNGTELSVGDLYDGTRIRLPGLSRDNEVRVVASCEYQHSGVGLHRFTDPADGRVYVHTQFEPFDAHRVFACFDQPDLKARTTLSVRAPQDWMVVSNTPTAAHNDDLWRFETTPPLSVYLLALVAGPYQVARDRHGEIDLGIYCRQSMRRYLDHEELVDLTKRGLDFFTHLFAYPYPFHKYDQLFVPEFSSGAMENPGCVTFSERYLYRGHVTEAEREWRANTLLHEMAHMWFGDLVTMRWWDDLWLNESFATFMATLACARATRFSNAWVTFADQEKAWARRQDQLPTTHPISADASDLQAVHQNFDGITYAKGASVLRQLVAWVGEDHFFAGCRRYFRRFEFANAELRDFLAELERTSGRDLSAWANTWLQTAGLNTLRPVYAVVDGRYGSFDIEQGAPPEWPTLRSHRTVIGIYDLRSPDELVRRRRLELDIVGPLTEVPDLVGEPVADLVLVNDEDLTFAKLQLDERSLETVTAQLAALGDPLARALCWSAAWDMLRDAVMPARRFAEMVRNNATVETDIGMLQTLLGRALTAGEFYGDPAHAPALVTALADHAYNQLVSAPPGSDRQLAWARHWISSSRTSDHWSRVRGLLDGQVSFEGVEVDTELRWQAVRALAGVGAADDRMIAAEHERDPTDAGERNAEAARAARPDPDAKAAAWQRIVGEPELSHSLMKAIMGGFMRFDQAELIRPYVPTYFEVLPRIWEERQLEVALAFAHRMYPTVVVEENLVARTDRELDGEGLAAPLRRALLEERDTVVRALRARQFDAQAATASV
ncbi:MAG: aminopeptidase N, partial [Actinomycetota bacterium]|nr:aminopeptidase N [Actinomycetota bacterium]